MVKKSKRIELSPQEAKFIVLQMYVNQDEDKFRMVDRINRKLADAFRLNLSEIRSVDYLGE